jgi:hypothetical protein
VYHTLPGASWFLFGLEVEFCPDLGDFCFEKEKQF